MFRKVSVVFGALALLAVASQGLEAPIVGEAQAKQGKAEKVYLCHKNRANGTWSVIKVSAGDSEIKHENHGDFEAPYGRDTTPEWCAENAS